MTPSKPSSGLDKTVTHTNHCSPDRDSDTEQPIEEDSERVLLPESNFHNELVYHYIDEDGYPLCRNDGQYYELVEIEAQKLAQRLCRKCEVIRNGGFENRPCPKCGAGIPIPQWPQHVRRCDSQSESSGESEYRGQHVTRGGKGVDGR